MMIWRAACVSGLLFNLRRIQSFQFHILNQIEPDPAVWRRLRFRGWEFIDF